MNGSKLIRGGLAAGVVSFLFSGLWHVALLGDFYESATAGMREPSLFWSIGLGYLVLGFIMAYMFPKMYTKGFGYGVDVAANGVEALDLMSPSVDLVVLDGEMPEMDGFEVARRIRSDESVADVPVVMVTGLKGREDRLRAFDLGINDVVSKPIDATELKFRARWLVSLKIAQDEIKAHGRKLEETVERRTRDLRDALAEVGAARLSTHEAHIDTIHRLTLAGEYKDQDTADHVARIGGFSEVVARRMKLPDEIVEVIRHAAPMHDVGKIGIPDAILLKPGKLGPVNTI